MSKISILGKYPSHSCSEVCSKQSDIFVFTSHCLHEDLGVDVGANRIGNRLKMEATARHEFNATADDELSFKKGSVVKVKRKPEIPCNLVVDILSFDQYKLIAYVPCTFH